MTTKVAIAGASGRMGRMLLEAVAAGDQDLVLGAAIVRPNSALCGVDTGVFLGGPPSGVLFSGDANAAIAGVDVVVDFTPPDAALVNAEYCASTGRPLVSGTTGFSTQDAQRFREATQNIPLCQASNFSTGVNLAYRLLAQAAAILGGEADIEISEAHHRHKVDAPSGTAIAMGEVVAETLGRNLAEVAVYGREGHTGERARETIGFSTLRAGDIVGDHTVTFAAQGERLEITHKASSRMAFARGALRAAVWLISQKPGMYDMQDVLGLKEN
ncbi:4-hydroxy-tetrahydrodipicolinate reductase [Luminiphilus sp. nBUS_16]|uniref:4-hydroxy-tetrahydrodipicolinate reductase n=1 Tax=Luminiphilus sp. nBUS_16 TaxID=3395315 RepID=UPI003EBCA70B